MAKRVLIGMSGGVDSSVSAYLMNQAGYDCIGGYMRLYDAKAVGLEKHQICPNLNDQNDACHVAESLGIPFRVFDCVANFEEKVIAKFIRSYECGVTPNPCVDCNRYLKFDYLMEKGMELGFDAVATGHYARVRQDSETGRHLLYRATDHSKDQSYMLYALTQQQLAHVFFPVGDMTKTQVREIAENQRLINARKRDSQDICFVPDGDYVAFMERFTGKKYEPGDYLDLNGNVVGRHKGAVRYTIGQRKGLDLAMGSPVYVCSKDMEANTVTVGPNEALFTRGLTAKNWNWIAFETLTGPMRVTAMARYNQIPRPATVYPLEDGMAKVVFDSPQRALTAGQAVVLYDGDLVVGGGTITQALSDV